MSGIYVGGKYMPRSHKVTAFATEFNKSYYYLTNHNKVKVKILFNEVEGMYHCAPEPLVFWSNEDE